MKRGIRFTKKYLGIQPHASASMTTTPVSLFTRWRLFALILRLIGVYLLFCVFWIGWHFALELIYDIRQDVGLKISQDLVFNTTTLIFLILGMSRLLWIIWCAYGRALRPLRKSASKYQLQAVDKLLQIK